VVHQDPVHPAHAADHHRAAHHLDRQLHGPDVHHHQRRPGVPHHHVAVPRLHDLVPRLDFGQGATIALVQALLLAVVIVLYIRLLRRREVV
jgi:hypothetical protein